MTKYLSNAFSLQMLQEEDVFIRVKTISPAEVPADAQSVIGHADTAAVVSSILGREVEMNRANVTLNKGDVLYVAQLTGGRLPEGSTTLPKGFSLVFKEVRVGGPVR